ncbi:zona pellucida sperm-binding protein 4-like [Periophthalmus magnuspinnatus]|uniref:zona pellucida sperm-binding protein 4-like n=1 Tax=Periophthalmus magnuspinnatus TaxID=409849 RepID=UPI0024368537|nr:zona pellucida sperm-binding protein 4-like [Periophthalmus magnuspinnatus]
MEGFTSLFGAVVFLVLACRVQSQWAPSYTQQQPWAQQLPKNPVPTVTPPPSDKCRVEDGAKIRCGRTDVTPEQCQNIDCCYDGLTCYYGKAVTVQCTRDGQFVVVVARDATLPRIDVESVSLLESSHESCSPAGVTAEFTIFQFTVMQCGTRAVEEDGYIVYENHMSSAYEVGIGPKGSITRDSHFELLFQCRYSGSAAQAVVMEVNDVPAPLPVAAAGPLRVELRLGNGQCHTKGCVEEVAAYSSYYSAADYPITKALRDPVYVEVRILERSDPNVVLTLDHCWATSAPAPHSMPQWDLLLNGCPYSEDHYLTKLVPTEAYSGLDYPTHYKRFIVQMFTFVDQSTYAPYQDTVYIHCSTSVCYPSSLDSCQSQCHRQRRSTAANVSSNQRTLVSSGKVILISDPSRRETTSTHMSRSKFKG